MFCNIVTCPKKEACHIVVVVGCFPWYLFFGALVEAAKNKLLVRTYYKVTMGWLVRCMQMPKLLVLMEPSIVCMENLRLYLCFLYLANEMNNFALKRILANGWNVCWNLSYTVLFWLLISYFLHWNRQGNSQNISN